MKKLIIIAILALSTASGALQAAPITYAFTGQISGSLNGQDFTLSNYSLSLVSDTDTIFQPQPNSRPTLINSGPGALSFTIDGSSGTFDSLFNVFSFTDPRIQNRALVGFTEAAPFGGNDIIDVRDPRLAGYDLRSAVSTGTNSPIDFLNFDTPFQTSAGELVFFNDDNASASFRSTLASVPEPATWGLMILGFGAVGGALRRGKSIKISYAL